MTIVAEGAVAETVTVRTPTLYEKLLEVATVIQNIEKNGKNEHQNYAYVTEADVKRAVREELLKRDILVIPSTVPGSASYVPVIGGKGAVTTIEIDYKFVEVTDRQANAHGPKQLTIRWTGAGSDIGGDKGLYKCYAGALKYMLLNLFLIPTGDDPEGDGQSAQEESEAGHIDDQRQAVPSIPLDRARAILELAVTAGLATMVPEGTKFKVELAAVLKAKLATVGVTTGKIADLNVDQAEDVEKWLTLEAKNVS